MFAVWPRSFRPRTGFTLIELMVVLGIIALLTALLIPAVQSARESARRAQCVANLKQVGLAMAGYEVDYQMFPPGYLSPLRAGRYTGFTVNNTSAFVRLLPYLEQRSVYSSINFELHGLDWPSAPIVENRTARSTTIAAFLCPSDGEPNHRNSYRLNTGRNVPAMAIEDGPFSFGFRPMSSSIPNGLSKTAFVSEGVGGSYQADHPVPTIDMKLPISLSSTDPIYHNDDLYVPYCVDSQAKGWLTTGGRYWYYVGVEFTAYNHNGSPNDPRSTCGGNAFGLLPPRSRHPGLVNVLYGDGHVESVVNTINLSAWLGQGRVN